jgi:Tfp pilus assembly protein PilX
MKIRQSGSVLAISLVLLTAITLIALTGLQRSGLQTKIVANVQHREMIFNCAQSTGDSAYKEFQENSTEDLSNAIEIRKNYDYQASLPGVDLSQVAGPGTAIASRPCNNANLISSATVTFQSNGNDPGNPNTSGLREDYSRGKLGSGIAKFELVSNANLTNNLSSSQALGFHLKTPEQ